MVVVAALVRIGSEFLSLELLAHPRIFGGDEHPVPLPFPERIKFDDPIVAELREVIADTSLCPDQLLNEILRVIHDDRVRSYHEKG